jgi:hypothetical protein
MARYVGSPGGVAIDSATVQAPQSPSSQPSLGAGQAAGAQKREQRGRGRHACGRDGAAVDDEVETSRGHRVRWPDG